jgi:hypothetical protein
MSLITIIVGKVNNDFRLIVAFNVGFGDFRRRVVSLQQIYLAQLIADFLRRLLKGSTPPKGVKGRNGSLHRPA